MTNEEKNLLLKDLCARFLYGVKVHTQYNLYEGYGKNEHKIGVKEQIGILIGFGDRNNVIVSFEDYNWEPYGCEDIKPYFRPMSSMTEDEREELKRKFCVEIREEDNGMHTEIYGYITIYHNFNGESWYIPFEAIDWLNAHHFDYRGLIEKGLALEALKDMYKFN